MSTDGGVDAGTVIEFRYETCPEAPPSQRFSVGELATEPGWFLPTKRAERNACIVATCEERLRQKTALSEPPPSWFIWSSVLGVAMLGLGITLGHFWR